MPSTHLVFCVWGTILVISDHCMVYTDCSVSVIDEVVQFATLFVICFPYLALKDEVLSVYCADLNLHIWACWNGATLYLLCLWIHDCFPLVLPIGPLLLHVSWIDYNPGMWIWGGWGCEVSCGGHHRPKGKTTTGSALDGAVFDTAQILAYLVHNMSRSQLYLGFGHFGWLPSFFGQ